MIVFLSLAVAIIGGGLLHHELRPVCPIEKSVEFNALVDASQTTFENQNGCKLTIDDRPKN